MVYTQREQDHHSYCIFSNKNYCCKAFINYAVTLSKKARFCVMETTLAPLIFANSFERTVLCMAKGNVTDKSLINGQVNLL